MLPNAERQQQMLKQKFSFFILLNVANLRIIKLILQTFNINIYVLKNMIQSITGNIV